MEATIIAAAIAALASIIVGILNARSLQVKTMQANKETITEIIHQQELHQQEVNAQHQQTIALIEFKLDSLTEEVRRHNNFAQRLPLLEEQMKNAKEEINELKKEA